MLCPGCDGILNAIGCQSCGWKTGDPFPSHRLMAGSSHPLKPGIGLYPLHFGDVRDVHHVKEDPGVLGDHHSIEAPRRVANEIRVAPGFNSPAPEIVPENQTSIAPAKEEEVKTVPELTQTVQ